jgi:hypothetical protein
MNDQQLHAHCLEWASWCFTRRFYLKSGAQNILARMQPSRTGVEPNARNNPDMQFFNMAIHTLADMKEYADARVCFTLMYVEQADHVKRQAEILGISRPTYYNRARSFARKALSLSHSLKRVHAQHAAQGQELTVD